MNVSQPLHCALFVLAVDNNYDNTSQNNTWWFQNTYIFGVWWNGIEVQRGVGKERLEMLRWCWSLSALSKGNHQFWWSIPSPKQRAYDPRYQHGMAVIPEEPRRRFGWNECPLSASPRRQSSIIFLPRPMRVCIWSTTPLIISQLWWTVNSWTNWPGNFLRMEVWECCNRKCYKGSPTALGNNVLTRWNPFV